MKQRFITLRYTINGAKFRHHYQPEHHEAARIRIAVLEEFNVEVRVVGWPKRIAVKPLTER